jgi:hypothetical protein
MSITKSKRRKEQLQHQSAKQFYKIVAIVTLVLLILLYLLYAQS